jgi:hypothetical protein
MLFLTLLFFISLKNFSINLRYLLSILIFFSLIFLQLDVYISTTKLDSNLILRNFFTSVALLFLLGFIVPFLYHNFAKIRETIFNLYIKAVTYFLIFIGYVSWIFQKIGLLSGKSLLIFPEPSHYGIVIIPLILYLTRLYNSYWFVANLYLLSILLLNVTMLVGSIIISFLHIKIKNFFPLFIVLTLIVFNLPEDNLLYFYDRLKLNTESNIANLSTLVYLSGWERAYLTLTEYSILGVGFNLLGFIGPQGYYQWILENLGYGALNLHDGGTLGAKLISELGYIGLLLIILYIYFLIKIISNFKNIKSTRNLFFMSYYISLSVEMFIRGVGYFSPNIIFYALSIYSLFFIKKYNYGERK